MEIIKLPQYEEGYLVQPKIKCGFLPVEVMLLNAVGISSNVIFVPADVAYFLTTRPTVTQILQT